MLCDLCHGTPSQVLSEGTPSERARAEHLLTVLTRSFEDAADRAGTWQLTLDFGGTEMRVLVSGRTLASAMETALGGGSTAPPARCPQRSETSRHETTPAETPPVETSPAETPPVETSPAETPPVETSSPRPFTVRVFDLVQCGIEAPVLPWGPEDIRAHGEVDGVGGDRIRAFCTWQERQLFLQVIDLVGRQAFMMLTNAGALPRWQRAAPMLTILDLALGSTTRGLTHGAVVGMSDGAALLGGMGGSGKSTTALLCTAAGMRYVADDYFLLDTGGPSPLAHGLFLTAKVTDAGLALLPRVDDFLVFTDAEEDKHVLHVPRAFPGSLTPTLPITTVVLPRVGPPGGRTAAHRIGAATAVRMLAPSSILQMVSDGGRALRRLADLARQLPCYALTLADDGAAPTVIEELLRSAVV